MILSEEEPPEYSYQAMCQAEESISLESTVYSILISPFQSNSFNTEQQEQEDSEGQEERSI